MMLASYIHQVISLGDLHEVVAKYEDWVVSIVFTIWTYDAIEERVKQWQAKRAAKNKSSAQLL